MLVGTREQNAKPGVLVRNANGADRVLFGKLDGNGEQGGEHVHMLVAVKVTGNDPGVADFLDLRVPLKLNLVEIELTSEDAKEQRLRMEGKLIGVVEQGANERWVGGGWTVTEIQVDADAEFGIVAGNVESGGEGEAVGDEGGAGEQTAAMGFENALIDPFGPGKVVSIDDEISHEGGAPVRRDSYSFEGDAAFVPLTAILVNFSMAC